MKKKRPKPWGWVIGTVVLLLILALAPGSIWDLLKQPLEFLWGAPRNLQTGVLEVSENVEPVQEATRRLLKPLGRLHVIRRYPPMPSPDAPTPPPAGAANPS